MRKLLLMVFMLLAGTRFCMANTLFEDTFSSSSSLNNWDVVAGTWKVEDGELHGKGAGGGIDGWIYAGDTNWEDYAYETKVHLINGNANIVFRSTGHWINEYRLILWSQQAGSYPNTFNFMKYTDGAGSYFSKGQDNQEPSPVPITDTINIKVIAMGDNLKGFINDQKLFEYVDTKPLKNGRIGLGVVWNLEGAFDNVVVSDFKSEVIPEPTTISLLGLGLLGLVFKKKR